MALRQGCHFIDILFAHADSFFFAFLFFFGSIEYEVHAKYIFGMKILSDRQLDSKNRKKERDIWSTLDPVQDSIF